MKAKALLVLCWVSLVIIFDSGVTDADERDGPSLRAGDDRDATRRFQEFGADSLINMTRKLLSKVSGTVLAEASENKLNNLNDDQLRGISESLRRSRNTSAINEVMDKLNKHNAVRLASDLVKKKQNITRNAKVSLYDDLRKKLGDPWTWSKENITSLGGDFLKEMRPTEIRTMAAKNRESFEALSHEISKSRIVSASTNRAIYEGAKAIHGQPNTWDGGIVAKYAKFLSPRNLKKLSRESVKYAADQLAKIDNLGYRKAREIVKKLAETDGFGTPNQWDSSNLKRLGKLVKGLTVQDIKNIRSNVLGDSREELEKIDDFSVAQRKEIMEKIKTVNSLENWGAEDLRKCGNLTTGLSPRDLGRLSALAVDDALNTLRDISNGFSQEQKREIAKKIEDPSGWTREKASKVGNLCYGKSSEDLKKIPPGVVSGLLNAMTQDASAPETKKRTLKNRYTSSGVVDLMEAGPVLEFFTLKDLENTNVEKDLRLDMSTTNKTSLHWKQDQARHLVAKVKQQKREPEKWKDEFIIAISNRSLLKGLSRKDISKLGFSDFVVEMFSEETKGLLPGQITAVIKAFKENRGMTHLSRVTQGDIASMGDMVADVSIEDLHHLSGEVGAYAVRKIGEAELKDKPRALIRTILRISLEIMEKSTVSKLTVDDILSLQNLLCGLTGQHIKDIKMEVFNVTRDTFGDRECFTHEQLVSLADKAKESFKGDGLVEEASKKMNGDDILELGRIAEGFSVKDIKKLPENAVQENMYSFALRNFSAEQAEALLNKTTFRPTRRKRALDVSKKTGAELVSLGNILLGLTPSHIADINNVAFDKAVSTIGNIDGFSRPQLEAWASKAKQAWNSDTSKYTASQLLRLGAIAIGFPDGDLRKMLLVSDDVIESLGSQRLQSAVGVAGYTSSQLKSALDRVKELKNKKIDKFSGDEISSLKHFAIAMTIQEIDSIPTSTFSQCIGSLGELSGWSVDQMAELTDKAIRSYGPLHTWSVAELREIGTIIGGFTSSELQSLSGEYVSIVAPDAIKNIPPTLFVKFKASQLEEFDSSQAASVTAEQRKALSDDLVRILDIKTGALDPYSSGAGVVFLSQSLFGLVLWTAILINQL